MQLSRSVRRFPAGMWLSRPRSRSRELSRPNFCGLGLGLGLPTFGLGLGLGLANTGFGLGLGLERTGLGLGLATAGLDYKTDCMFFMHDHNLWCRRPSLN